MLSRSLINKLSFLPSFMFKDVPKPLGRWGINKCDIGVSVTNYHSNIDHCGDCYYEKTIIENFMKYKKKNIKNQLTITS